jgi:hypothetical protein
MLDSRWVLGRRRVEAHRYGSRSSVITNRTENVCALIEAGYEVGPERQGLLPLAADKPEIQKLLRKLSARKVR